MNPSLLFMFYVCHAFLSVVCQPRGYPMGKGWPLCSLLSMMFSCVFVTFPCGVLGQVWYLIVSISYLCLFSYFYNKAFRLLHNIDNISQGLF